MPKVSLVIPAYNIESYIRRCIESVKHQTFTDFEAIVVDDASTDTPMRFSLRQLETIHASVLFAMKRIAAFILPDGALQLL